MHPLAFSIPLAFVFRAEDEREVKTMARVVTILGWVLLVAGAALVITGLASIAIKDGIWAALQLLSPFNVVNFVAIVTALAPGIALIAWGERLKAKQEAQSS